MPVSSAQSLVWEWAGVSNELFGAAVDGVGDINCDGHEDILVGAYGNDTVALDSGSAVVLSGIDGTPLYSFFGQSVGDNLGKVVAGVGDTNLDGVPDFLVSAPRDDRNDLDAGVAFLYSGADGSVRRAFYGVGWGDQFGSTVESAGDVNQDGRMDLIVGTRHVQSNSGEAWVLSGQNGQPLHYFTGNGGNFAESAAGGLDVNRDGVPDLLFGAPSANQALVYSGLDGTLLHQVDGINPGDQLGSAVDFLGDVNADGFGDFLVGARKEDLGFFESGSVRAFSGVDKGELYAFSGAAAEDEFGLRVRRVGDLNGDGITEFCVSAPENDNAGSQVGNVELFSGAGSRIWSFDGPAASEQFGLALGRAGDVNGDGIPDLVVGSSLDDQGGSGAGRAWVYSGNDLYLLASPTDPGPGANLKFRVRRGPPGSRATLFAVSFGGVPLFRRLDSGVFNSGGQWTENYNVPAGLSGMQGIFVSYAFGFDGSIIDSELTTVDFQ